MSGNQETLQNPESGGKYKKLYDIYDQVPDNVKTMPEAFPHIVNAMQDLGIDIGPGVYTSDYYEAHYLVRQALSEAGCDDFETGEEDHMFNEALKLLQHAANLMARYPFLIEKKYSRREELDLNIIRELDERFADSFPELLGISKVQGHRIHWLVEGTLFRTMGNFQFEDLQEVVQAEIAKVNSDWQKLAL